MVNSVYTGQPLYAGHPVANGIGHAMSKIDKDGFFNFNSSKGIFRLHLNDVYEVHRAETGEEVKGTIVAIGDGVIFFVKNEHATRTPS